ncbi:group II intron reverse transcriptase/maturase [Acidobacteria bacterium AH-259-A15]|nr:group II intron reverse transcriptase/maturase [Acidobacteria bacterium AH-259-A15]
MRLKTPEKVRKLQRTFYAKAKEEPNYRFYLLYDKVYREDIVAFAYRRCKANGGVAGVDGQTFGDIETYGRQRWLRELAEELREKRYRPQPVRRVRIEKENGGERPLGIPTIKDRVVQMAAVLVIEPIFEADLEPEQYGYRPKRSAQDAVRKVHQLLNRGYREVVDADLSSYFDTIPHRELMKCVARRISDRHLLRLIKMWLKAPVQEEKGEKGGGRHRREKGTPQGAPLSPLLANLYFRRLVLAWKKLGLQQKLDAYIVNYADDFVICCGRKAEEALKRAQAILRCMKVILNEEKTRIRRIPEESFDFLGYTIGQCYSTQTGKPYIGTRPSKKRISRLCREISEATQPKWLFLAESVLVTALNRKLEGWANYFYLGPVSKAYRAVDTHARYRLRQWLRRKHKARQKGKTHFPDEYLYAKLGLVQLERRTRNLPWAKA